ncbi:MAG TPA: molybdate ABC transporter substrate-binding protein [Symbiobacteriaceae bacterium]|nr:molybdate ABC transporter substrate-binding protein [Symbiobacteriaceae bacterium]
MRKVALLFLTLLVLAGCAPKPESAEIIVSAAASMTDALKEVQPGFEAANPTVKLKFNFGSSGALQQQIEQGAPADLFISAAAGPMDALVKKGLVESPVTVATNKVVLIRSKSGEAVVKAWADLRSDAVKRVALANPQHVPAGQYGKAVLETLGIWAAIEKRLILGEDVRQVLNYVESGEVQAGIVYSTDAASSQKVTVVAVAPAGSHAPVVYPMAVLKGSKQQAAAKAFADYLRSEQGKQVLTKYGFGQ